MEQINNRIKVVIWDLDETLWNGTLAEVGEVKLRPNVDKIIRELNKRGIVNTICSKNDYKKTKECLEKLGIWDLFVFPRIEFKPKGQIIKDMLADMYLRADNALFIDDNESNLNEAILYNTKINVISADLYDTLLDRDYLKGKKDSKLLRLQQYKQLESKTVARKKESSNEEFLRKSNIRLYLCEYRPNYFDRVSELVERTNQLNFTKKRMEGESLKICLETNKTVLCYVVDDFGDYGIAGFYTLKDNELIHFVFSCRIMNMGIEQFLYDYIGRPTLKVVGEVATEVGTQMSPPDWVNVQWKDSFDVFLRTNTREKKFRIFAIGACDLFKAMSFFEGPEVELVYECNYYKNLERSINVGTEYIRSCFEFTEEQKIYCREHFANYSANDCFKTEIFASENSVVVMSFLDDIEFKIYTNKKDSSLRIIRSDSYKHGNTSILANDGSFMKYSDGEKWIADNFCQPEFISKKRFKENLLWIADRINPSTKILLITAPEMDFYKSRWPKEPEMKERNQLINCAIRELCNEKPNRFDIVEINECVKTRDDVTDYIFHLKPTVSYNLYKLIHKKVAKILPEFPSIKEVEITNSEDCDQIMPPIEEAIMRGQHKTDNPKFKNQIWSEFRKDAIDKKVVIWGVGTGTNVFFERCPDIVVDFAIDKDQSKIGKNIAEVIPLDNCQYSSITINSKDALLDYSNDEVVIVIGSLLFYEQIGKELEQFGYNHFYSLLQMEANKIDGDSLCPKFQS